MKILDPIRKFFRFLFLDSPIGFVFVVAPIVMISLGIIGLYHERGRQARTVREGFVMDGIHTGILTEKIYTVERRIYLDSDGKEVFRLESHVKEDK